ncbi:hypothetical protein [Streptomyces sp. NPDC059071]|uniref:hypothetical protein n=1 Tax=unclassified Streptomyces TaxID=2593676 RepID=UPI003648DD5E
MTGCVFCGAPANSREHVIPQWLSKGPREDIPGIYQKSVVVDLDGTILRDVRHRFGDMTVKCVCTTCNNGWMNDLEEGVRPFLLPLILGTDKFVVILDRQMQSDLAAWAMKTIMMFSFTNPKEYHGVIPAADFTYLYRYRRLSTRRMIARTFHMPVRAYGTDEEVLFEWHLRKSVNPRGIVGFLRLGHFGIQVCSIRLSGDKRLNKFKEFPNALPLWPPTERWVWPPEEKCEEGHIDALIYGGHARSFGTSKKR